ncbi:hypothetical protein AMTRI_Chr12g236870 [Amborella trichopoda]
MPQIKAQAPLVDVLPPPTYVHSNVGAHPNAYYLSSDSRYTNSDKRISPGSMHASDSYCLSAQQPVVYVGVSYRAGFSGYPMGVPPSQNLRAGPSPSVNGKIRGQRFIPTPQILAEPKMEESSAGARV